MAKENKPIIQATLGDLKEMIEDMFATATDYPNDKPPEVKRHLVYGLAGLAKLLGVCKSTASKIKSSGILNPAISQHGKVIVIDADLALELMKARQNVSAVSNNKTKYRNYGRIHPGTNRGKVGHEHRTASSRQCRHECQRSGRYHQQ